MLNVAIIGMGNYGKKRANSILHSKKMKLVAIIDPRINSSEYLNKPVFSKISELPKNIDLYIVATPNHTHFKICSELLKFEKLILCEKPLCININELHSLKESLSKNNTKLFMGTNLRHFPSFKYLETFLKERNIENFKSINCNIGHSNLSQLEKWFFELNESGGGALIDNGIHLIQFLGVFLTKLKPLKVSFDQERIENDIKIFARSQECDSIEITASRTKSNEHYASVDILLNSGDKISIGATNDNFLFNGEKIEIPINQSSIDEEFDYILSKVSNFSLSEETLKFIFSSYDLREFNA